jgi:hypothetical protein|tara:strand:- start:87 stop:917 length:831 start_codon:yes stop_codon:yes gene_type:complete
MNKKFYIAGGCSFTFGHELSDDVDGKTPSKKSWAYQLFDQTRYPGAKIDYITAAHPGTGNPGIARRVFNAVSQNDNELQNAIDRVVVMWSFNSRYDWAMPRHRDLEGTRWATISPWDTSMADGERHNALSGSEVQQAQWKHRQDLMIETGVKPFAEAIYKHAANEYHETYLSWKSIIWLQNILEKRRIKYMFTLADNSLFYKDFDHHKDQDPFMTALHDEIDLTKWFSFGERMMGFNQWASLNEYERATTHPLDKAHEDAVNLMIPTYKKILTGGK